MITGDNDPQGDPWAADSEDTDPEGDPWAADSEDGISIAFFADGRAREIPEVCG